MARSGEIFAVRPQSGHVALMRASTDGMRGVSGSSSHFILSSRLTGDPWVPAFLVIFLISSSSRVSAQFDAMAIARSMASSVRNESEIRPQEGQ